MGQGNTELCLTSKQPMKGVIKLLLQNRKFQLGGRLKDHIRVHVCGMHVEGKSKTEIFNYNVKILILI